MINRDSGVLVGLHGAIQRIIINGNSYDQLLSLAVENSGVVIYRGAPCTPNPCLNDGLCIPVLNTFTCRCTITFVGKLCQTSKLNGSILNTINFTLV